METVKSALGLGSTTESDKEPVNADQGVGTATEPFDGGNKEENVPAVTEETSGKEPINAEQGAGTATAPYDGGNKEENVAGSTSDTAHTDAKPTSIPPGTSPAAAAIVSDGATEEPDSTVGASAPKTADSTVPPTNAVGASATKTVDELGQTTTPATEAGATNSNTGVTALPIPPKDTKPAETKPAKKEKKTIGTPGWFQNTLQRRKSKGNKLQTESEKGPKVPEKDTPPSTATAGAAGAAATAAAATVVVADSKQPVSAPITEPVVQPAPKKEVVEPKQPVQPKTENVEPKPKHKRGKSVSETLKSAFSSKRRQSKDVKPEAKKEDKAAAVVSPPNHLSTDVPVGEAPPAAKHELTPGSEPAVSKSSALPVVAETTTRSKYADDDIAPDELPPDRAEEVVSKPAGETSKSVVAGETVAAPVPAEKTVADETPVATSSADETVASHQPVIPEETAATSAAAAEDDIAPDEKPTTSVVAPTETKTDIPTINEPADSGRNEPVSSVADSGRNEYGLGKGKAPSTEDRRLSRAPKGENVSAIPTAGGVRLGENAEKQRRASADVRPKSVVPEDVTTAAAPTPAKADATPTIAEASTTPTPAKAETKAEAKKDDTPKRRSSVFDKLKEKLRT